MEKKQINKCPNCSYENASDAKFCQNCGVNLQPACLLCGTLNSLDAKFCKNCGTRLGVHGNTATQDRLASLQQAAPQSIQEKIQAARTKIEGERKPVVILFTDIIDSTSMAEKLDPEDWREIVTGAHQLVIDAVYRYEGTIAQLLGDGVLAFFGAPITHEDDPLRAVHAGMEIQDAISSYRDKVKSKAPDFQMRVGVNTGLVVVGNIGNDLHIEYLAVGDAVNLAARIQSLASPGKVVISESVFQSISHTIHFNDLGQFIVKGKQEPIQIYQVNGFRNEPFVLREIAETSGEMIGREAELHILQELTEVVQAGIGRSALIVGEPGVGKSRLISEWKTWVDASCPEDFLWVEAHCPSYGKTMAYCLIIELLNSLVHRQAIDTQTDTRLALNSVTRELFGEASAEIYAYLGHLMALELDEKDLGLVRGMDPRALQIQYLASMKRLLLALAAQKSLVLVFEDLHWADPSSVEILVKLLPALQEAPVFFCFTSRQEIDAPGWQLVTAAQLALGARLTELHLRPLTQANTEQMISSLLSIESLPSEVLELVFEKTEGNPLFVEEVVSTLVEDGGLIKTQAGWAIHGDIAAIEIPDTLKRLVLARIDRLGEEPKRVVRIASVIGRQFIARVLERVLAESQQKPASGQLVTHLSALEATDLIRLLAARPEVVYLFKHALIHEAVYEAVLKADRKVLHRAVAQSLEMTYPDRVDELAPTLGYHYSRGEVHDKAADYLTRAAEAAKTRYANQEAIGLYRSAIEEAGYGLKETGQEAFWREKLVRLQESLADVLSFTGHHDEGIQVYHRALDILPAFEAVQRSRLYRKIGNAWMTPRRTGEALQAYDLAEAALGSISDEQDPNLLNAWIDVQLDRVWACYFLGQIPEMISLVQKVRPLVEKHGTPLAQARFFRNLVLLAFRRDRFQVSAETVEDARRSLVAARESGELGDLNFSTFVFGFCHLWRRELDVAEEYLKVSLNLSEKIGDMERFVMSLTYLTIIFRQLDQIELTIEYATRSLEAASIYKMPSYISLAKANQAWILWKEGKLNEAEQLGREALEITGRAPSPTALFAPWPLIDILLRQGRKDEAIELAEQVVDLIVQKIPGLEEALHQAIDAWNCGDHDIAMHLIHQGSIIARENRLM